MSGWFPIVLLVNAGADFEHYLCIFYSHNYGFIAWNNTSWSKAKVSMMIPMIILGVGPVETNPTLFYSSGPKAASRTASLTLSSCNDGSAGKPNNNAVVISKGCGFITSLGRKALPATAFAVP